MRSVKSVGRLNCEGIGIGRQADTVTGPIALFGPYGPHRDPSNGKFGRQDGAVNGTSETPDFARAAEPSPLVDEAQNRRVRGVSTYLRESTTTLDARRITAVGSSAMSAR